jgi:hypothetical protein
MTMTDCLVGARWVAVVAALALALALAPVTGASAEEHDDELFCVDVPPADIADRGDVSPTHLANVDCVLDAGIARGTTIDGATFYLPRNRVTRGQMATFIAQTLDATEIDLPEPDAEGGVTFTDITGHTHADNIRRIANAGIVRGTGNNQFSPNDHITRQQMATFVVQAGAYAYDATLGEGDWTPDGDYFGDVNAANTHFANINLGYELALFSGTTPPGEEPRSGVFTPARTVIRDQMATFLVNLAQFIFEGEWVEVDPTDIEVTGPTTADVGDTVTIVAEALVDEDTYLGDGIVDWTVSGASGALEWNSSPLDDGFAGVDYEVLAADAGESITVTGTLRDTTLSDSHTFTVTEDDEPELGPNAIAAYFIDAGEDNVFGDDLDDAILVHYQGQPVAAADATISVDSDGDPVIGGGTGAATIYTNGVGVDFDVEVDDENPGFYFLVVSVTDPAVAEDTDIEDGVSLVRRTTGVADGDGNPSRGYWEIIEILVLENGNNG